MDMAESVPAPDSRVRDRSDSPRVAVIVPAYGVADLVGEALASVQAQTFADWECIVIDDGAPDDVAGAVAPFLEDSRICLVHTANAGVSAARNRAIASSSAPLLTLLDGDDLLRPDYLSVMVPLLEDNPGITIATCNARMFGAVNGEVLCFPAKQPEGTLARVLDRSFGIHIASTFRRADWERVGGFDPVLRQCEDFDLWVRLLLAGGKAHYVAQVLGDYRVRAGSASADAGMMLAGNLRVYQKAQALLPADAPEHPLLRDLIEATRAAQAFERAIDRIVAGDLPGGMADLKLCREKVAGPVWAASFALWRIAPALARPMLRWRRRRHSRGYQPRTIRQLLRRGRAA